MQPLLSVTVTLYSPLVLIVKVWFIELSDHKYNSNYFLRLKTKLSPSQIVGSFPISTNGIGWLKILIVSEASHPLLSNTETK